jgi:hypothetical protein
MNPQGLLNGAFIMILGFCLRSSWIMCVCVCVCVCVCEGGKQKRGSHLEGFSSGSVWFLVLSSSCDFRGTRTTGPCLQQTAYSISSWQPGLLSLTYSISNWQTQSSSNPNFGQKTAGLRMGSWVQIVAGRHGGGRKIINDKGELMSATMKLRKTRVGECYLETRKGSPCPKLSSINKTVCERCSLCARNTLRQGPIWKYLLVFVYTFLGWMEAFPTQTEKAQHVARHLLKEIIPWFGISVSIGSDNGMTFVAEVVQLMAKGLKIT